MTENIPNGNSPYENRQPMPPLHEINKSFFDNNGVAVLAGVATGAVAAGAGVLLTSAITPDDAVADTAAVVDSLDVGVIEANPLAEVTEEVEETETVELAVRTINPLADNQVTFATNVNDSMSFAQAFATARAQVGAGGVFEWHGKLYGTYYKDEWDSMDMAARNDYNSHFAWSKDFLGGHGSEVEANSLAQTTVAKVTVEHTDSTTAHVTIETESDVPGTDLVLVKSTEFEVDTFDSDTSFEEDSFADTNIDTDSDSDFEYDADLGVDVHLI